MLFKLRTTGLSIVLQWRQITIFQSYSHINYADSVINALFKINFEINAPLQ